MSWSHTLHSPKSKLANRSNPKLIAKNLGRVTSDLYKWQESQTDRPELVLHDGPPYANGESHMGHALNKVSKDFITRFGVLSGHRVNYIPGWDCHGLPIEHAASKNYKKSKQSESKTDVEIKLSSLQRRRLARSWAMKMVGHQLKSFKGFGVMADWEDPSKRYLTLDTKYVARELRVFMQLVEKGLIFRQRKPVFWSVESGTALAESELVYGEHTSTAAYLGYPLKVSAIDSGIPVENTELAVWTTTPWTLVANQAIAVNIDMEYVLVEIPQKKSVCAKDSVPNLVEQGILLKDEIKILHACKGSELVGMTYYCPLRHIELPVVAADHVTNTAGTGLVHTAPGHGKEDYQVGQKVGLKVSSPVDGRGKYTAEVSDIPGLVGLNARVEGQQLILDSSKKSGCLLGTHKIMHSVPLDWRTKTPVMVRATPQFFMDLGATVKQLAVAAIDKVSFKPESAKQRLLAFTESRSDWCISRQRPWGVPIPVLFNKDTDEPLMNVEAVDHIIERIDGLGDKGLDMWFSNESDEQLEAWLPLSMQGKNLASHYRKCQDTLDVWLDSGSSWAMLKNPPADFYLEGSDQHRGWFQSSLLLYVAMTGKAEAPFKKLITHGFVLDEHRQKMSKSSGNTVEPQQMIKEIGIDGSRLLIAQGDYTSDISLNSTSTQQVASMIKKFRSTFKYSLGNLNEFDADALKNEQIKFSSLDLFALNRLNHLIRDTKQAYSEQNFQVVVKLVQAHMNTDLSAVYFDAVKDTLYADAKELSSRKGVQMVLWHISNTYVRMLAPILPLLTQEVWDVSPSTISKNQASPLMEGYPELINTEGYNVEEALSCVGKAMELRPLVNDAVEKARSAGHIGSSLASDVYINSKNKDLVHLDPRLSETLFITSQVKINEIVPSDAQWQFTSASEDTTVTAVPASHHKCGRCWKYTAPVEDKSCTRCEDAVSNQSV